MSPAPHISPRVRAYGKARIDITRRAKDEEEWRRLWKAPSQPYPFTAGEGWKFNLVYTVDDYAAEIGFFIDVLGFQVLAFSPEPGAARQPGWQFCIHQSLRREMKAPALRRRLCAFSSMWKPSCRPSESSSGVA